MSGATSARTGRYDVAVLGAGAAGMMCAAVAGQNGARVVLRIEQVAAEQSQVELLPAEAAAAPAFTPVPEGLPF